MRVPKIQGVAVAKNWEHGIVASVENKRAYRNSCETFRPFVHKHPVGSGGRPLPWPNISAIQEKSVRENLSSLFRCVGRCHLRALTAQQTPSR
jgi:hypothetical protein